MNGDNTIKLRPGDEVGWKWGAAVATGVVKEILSEHTEIVSKGKRVVRNGTAENPAVIIRHKSGNPVLKLASEIQKLK